MHKQVAVITGGSKGIGKALVLQFCKEGYQVYTAARDSDSLKKLANEAGGLPGTLNCESVDMSDKHAVVEWASKVKKDNVRIDVLINNVGVFLPGNLMDEAEGQLEQQMNTNLYSAYYLTRVFCSVLNGGHIFNMCSTASIAPYPGGGSYSITKYALLGFSHNLREELKDTGTKVTAVLPGNTLTPSWGETDIPEKHFIKATDVASSIYDLTLLSPNTTVEELLIQPQFKRQ